MPGSGPEQDVDGFLPAEIGRFGFLLGSVGIQLGSAWVLWGSVFERTELVSIFF